MVSDRDLEDRLHSLWASTGGPLFIGVTGAVAAGKSTLAAALAQGIGAWPEGPRVEVVCTDGFLRPNAELDAAGLTRRKGFPETYDSAKLNAALWAVRRGATIFPVYSHQTYDVDPALARRVEAPHVLIVEGLGFSASTPVDTLIYLDAAEADLEAWYVGRFLHFCEEGRADPASFYARFASLDAASAAEMAKAIWGAINLPNLRQHIMPVREISDIVVRKRTDHGFESIEMRSRSRRAATPSEG